MSPNKKFVPGPGAYDSPVRDNRTQPSWGFGTQKRPGLHNKFVCDVGPGQYKVPSKAVEGQ